MDLISKNFNNFPVRILLIDSEEWFIAKDMALLLEYKDTDQAIRQHCKNAKSYSVNLTGQLRKTKLIQEPDVWRLIIKSKMPEAVKIEEWIFKEVLPSIRKTGSYSISQNSQTSPKKEIIEINLLGLEFAFKNLRPSEASKIKMTEKLYTKLDLETCYLPKYTEENLTYSLTHLLKKYEVGISTQKANLRLLELGILEKLHRNSVNRTVKYFWSFTEMGLKFGKNMTSPKNERETQPHFFEKEFLELIKLF
ncbi:prophage antirepressor [Thiovulum sp. ES]|nr:prophage antirepressor [Thiovulum sp. ES]